MCTRLTRLGSQGRSITLKLMVRAEAAPLKTAKFLGHGVCDSISRSVQLAAATRDPELVSRQVWSRRNPGGEVLEFHAIFADNFLIISANFYMPSVKIFINLVSRVKFTVLTKTSLHFATRRARCGLNLFYAQSFYHIGAHNTQLPKY